MGDDIFLPMILSLIIIVVTIISITQGENDKFKKELEKKRWEKYRYKQEQNKKKLLQQKHEAEILERINKLSPEKQKLYKYLKQIILYSNVVDEMNLYFSRKLQSAQSKLMQQVFQENIKIRKKERERHENIALTGKNILHKEKIEKFSICKKCDGNGCFKCDFKGYNE